MKHIYIIGCGGTGSWLASPLCRFLAATNYEGDIWFIDGDNYNENNFDRQEFAAALMGENKAECQALMMCKRFMKLEPKIKFFDDYLGPNNINMIEDDCVVFNCVDNNFARTLVDNHIAKLNNAVHICSGNDKIDGQVQYHIIKDGVCQTRPVSEQFPELLEDTTGDRSAMSCEELSQLPSGGQFIMTNFMAAAIMLSFFTSYVNFSKRNWYPCDTIKFDINFVTFNRLGIKELSL